MDQIFKTIVEYFNFRFALLVGDAYCSQKINQIIANGLIHQPLEHREQPTLWEDLYMIYRKPGIFSICGLLRYYERRSIKYETVNDCFPNVSVIDVLLSQCRKPKYAFKMVQHIINTLNPIRIQCDSSIISAFINNYAGVMAYVTEKTYYNMVELHNAFLFPICNFVRFAIDNKLIIGNIIVDVCDMIACADVELLKYMIDNNYVKYPSSIKIINHLIDRANKNNINMENQYSSCLGDCEYFSEKKYVDMTKILIKRNILPQAIEYASEIKNNLLLEYFQELQFKHNVMNSLYILKIPKPIGNIIANYDWEH